MSGESITQLVTPIAMIILIVMQRRDASSAARHAEQVKETLAKTEETVNSKGDKREKKIDEIHDLVNGGLTEAKNKIEKQTTEIRRLNRMLREMKK